jgi:hypothetical protein
MVSNSYTRVATLEESFGFLCASTNLRFVCGASLATLPDGNRIDARVATPEVTYGPLLALGNRNVSYGSELSHPLKR